MKFLLAALTAAVALAGPVVASAQVTIGLAVSQTGNLADSATQYTRGGLLGKQVKLVVYDDRSDPATAARLYERLITDDKVDFLISTIGSAPTATATAIAEKHKRVMINGGGASEAIQERGFKYIFQTAARISAYVDGVEPIMKKYGVKSMAFVSRDYGAARDMEKALKPMAERSGVKFVMAEYFPAGNVDFSSQIARARQAKPDLWVSVGYPNEAIELVRQFRASNYSPKIFIHNGVAQEDFLKAIGKDGDGAIGMSLYEPTLKTAGNDEFVKTFQDKYKYQPSYYSAFGFVAGTVLEAAVKKAGSFDQEAVRNVLTTLKMETVMGAHQVDPVTGMQIGVKGLLVEVLNGKREVIWPEALRTAEPKIPAPGWDVN
jgi:branched-chain amino acid transport system substrate-binding protein